MYAKRGYSKKKSTDIFLKSIAFFNVKALLLPSQAKHLKELTLQKFPTVQFDSSPSDMVYSQASDLKSIKTLLSTDQQIHNDTVLFVDKIHHSKRAEREWDWIKTHKKVRVTVDLFYCGIAFCRKELAKEHFKIRI